MAEWHTRLTQNQLSLRNCGFESHQGYGKVTSLKAGLIHKIRCNSEDFFLHGRNADINVKVKIYMGAKADG